MGALLDIAASITLIPLIEQFADEAPGNADRATLSPRIALIDDCNWSKVDVCDRILSVHGAPIFPSMATERAS
jgi:hypothetical protein